MATERLQFILDAVDNTKKGIDSAKKGFDSAKDKIESLQPAFKKMAAIGTASFAVIAGGVGMATQEAAKAEGSWNKFNTVFGEGSDAMRAFVDDIRTEMPTATHEIARMAADLQDLLVPMGLARDEAQGLTQGFLDVANKVAAFNDVDPTEVLEAFKSGLAGSSEPLRRFGINALESSLELEAMNSGLLKSGEAFKDLDPITRSQIKAQALLTLSVKQSSDAINGFAVNNDSLIRRQQELKANFQELSVTLGNIFLPIIDSLVKKILPVVQNMARWAEENPKLAKFIIIAAGALSALVAGLGFLGIALPFIISGVTMLGTAFMFLMSPIGLTIALILAIAALVYVVIKNWDFLVEAFKRIWASIKEFFVKSVNFIINLMKMFLSSIADPWINTFNLLKSIFVAVFDAVKEKVKSTVESIKNFLEPIIDAINKIIDGLERIGKGVGGKIRALFGKGGNIDDGIVQNGRIITTHPKDYIMAAKDPSEFIAMGGGSGQNIQVNITGNSFMGERDMAVKVGDQIIQTLKLSTRLT